jgi:hypothetical protein
MLEQEEEELGLLVAVLLVILLLEQVALEMPLVLQALLLIMLEEEEVAVHQEGQGDLEVLVVAVQEELQPLLLLTEHKILEVAVEEEEILTEEVELVALV